MEPMRPDRSTVEYNLENPEWKVQSPPAAVAAPADEAIDRNEFGVPGRPRVRDIPCDRCGGEQFLTLFEKQSSRQEVYQVVSCIRCSLVQVNPQPDARTVAPYYSSDYFTRRTDRGYDNYFSDRLKVQIQRVYEQNLTDLRFFEYEDFLRSGSWLLRHCAGPAGGRSPRDNRNGRDGDHRPRSLDVGCAAGYFVQYLEERGWNATGIELSRAAARHGVRELNLNILVGDFLSCRKLEPASYDLISLWASIEHMHSPRQVLERSFELLKPGGRMLLSTCRYGILARMRGTAWRFMNVPEHLYFFRLEGLTGLAEEIGFVTEATVSYGSGFTARADASAWYRVAKRIADPLVKRWNMGDMMALHLARPA
jgi:2-polyprenyl-3-methyl-5-hydroxy-6-metoxy-1,4-benzoquinol methylase